MSKGLVYILTNPCLDGWVKIGMTERNDIESRLQELNSPTNIPLSYRCYAVYEVENPLEVEKNIHSLIDSVNESLRARERLNNGKIREREFFKISPEKAYQIFKNIANLRGDVGKLRIYEPTVEQSQEQEIAEEGAVSSRISFAALNIHVGEKIVFIYDDAVTAKVINEKNQVEYENTKYTITKLAQRLFDKKMGWSPNCHVNGWKCFMRRGIPLSDMYNKLKHG